VNVILLLRVFHTFCWLLGMFYFLFDLDHLCCYQDGTLTLFFSMDFIFTKKQPAKFESGCEVCRVCNGRYLTCNNAAAVVSKHFLKDPVTW